jgi:hypothetical protein
MECLLDFYLMREVDGGGIRRLPRWRFGVFTKLWRSPAGSTTRRTAEDLRDREGYWH